jgi:hypothetical protein
MAPNTRPSLAVGKANGIVDNADYLKFRSTLGKCRGAKDFLAAADYDGSGCVNMTDYQKWYQYYKQYMALR